MSARPSRIVIYASPFCGYCNAAKRLLERKGLELDEIDVTAEPQRRQEMVERSGRRTVPQIFFGATHIGGYDDLHALEAQGRLDALLAADDDQPRRT